MKFEAISKLGLGLLLAIGTVTATASPAAASTLNCQLDEFSEGPELAVSAVLSKVDEAPGKEAEIPTEDIAITFTDFVFSGRLQPNDSFGAGLMETDGKTTDLKNFHVAVSTHGKFTYVAVRYNESADVDVLKCVPASN